MEATPTKTFRCSDGCSHLDIELWWDEPDQERQYALCMYMVPRTPTMFDRIKSAWKGFNTGHPFPYEIILPQQDVEELVKFITPPGKNQAAEPTAPTEEK